MMSAKIRLLVLNEIYQALLLLILKAIPSDCPQTKLIKW